MNRLADPDVEVDVIAAILRDPNAYVDLPNTFDAEVFTRPDCRRVYTSASEVGKGGDVPNLQSVRRRLAESGGVSADIGFFLNCLTDRRVLTGSECEAAVSHLLDLKRRRRLVVAGQQLEHTAGDLATPVAQIEGEHERHLLALDLASEPDTVSALQAAREYDDELRALIEGRESPRFATGIENIDRRLKINPTDLVLLGGRPANGKSILALQIARSVAGQGLPVMFAGLEMHRSELHRRMLRAETGLTREEVLVPRGPLLDRVSKANNTLSKLAIEYGSDPDIDAILRSAARLRRRKGLALLVVDYIQRLRVPQGGMTRDQALGEAAARLKDFAARFEVPVLAVAALSRESSRREDPRPRLEDLRESGRLEYEANSVVFVHVPCRVMGTPENLALIDPRASMEDRRRARSVAELIVAKQRDAEDLCAVDNVTADFDHTRFVFGRAA